MKVYLFALFFIFILGCTSQPYVKINGVDIFVVVVDEPEERSIGLMFQEELCEDCGMLFVFEEAEQHGFWMKNTLIPLDIIFVDENEKIVDIISAKPCLIEPCEIFVPKDDALYALEVNSGFSTKHSFSVGDSVALNLL